MAEVYVSTDVETDGPLPGVNSLLSLASAAYAADAAGKGTLLGTFTANLELLPGASGDPVTMEWWATQPEAWKAHRTDLEAPEAAMRRYLAWLQGLPGKPVFVAWPATFDFLFVHFYLRRFTGQSPFSFAALDLKSFAMALSGGEFRETSKRTLPARWVPDLPHTHVALDDALEQGQIFLAMLAESRARLRQAP